MRGLLSCQVLLQGIIIRVGVAWPDGVMVSLLMWRVQTRVTMLAVTSGGQGGDHGSGQEAGEGLPGHVCCHSQAEWSGGV